MTTTDADHRGPGASRAPLLDATPLGAWATNCLILGDRSRGEAVVIDPGQGAEEAVPDLLARVGLRPVAILLTHGHLDHLWSAPALARRYVVPVHLHPDDRWLWDAPHAAFGPQGRALAASFGLTDWDPSAVEVRPLADGQRLEVAGVGLLVQHTPGHTPGHVTFVTDDLVGAPIALEGHALSATGGVLVSGDLLFAGSIGRTDLAGGDGPAMMASLAAVMAGLPDETLVVPGHGPATTIGEERRSNPFLA